MKDCIEFYEWWTTHVKGNFIDNSTFDKVLNKFTKQKEVNN